MSTVSKSFTAVGVSAHLSLAPGKSLTYDVAGTFSGTVVLEQSDSPNAYFKPVTNPAVSKTAEASGTVKNESPARLWYRFRCSVYASGTIETELADVVDTQEAQSNDEGSEVFAVDELGIRAGRIVCGSFEITATHTALAGTGSFQPAWVDLTIEDDAGSDDGTDPAFLAPFMGNVMGDDVAGEGNTIAGVIGAYSLAGCGSDYPKAGLLGILMDGAQDADAIVVAHIDGSDPSAATNARAAFGVTILNNHASTGVEYGVDLHYAATEHISDGIDFTCTKAQMRLTNEVCIITGADTPVDYTDGDPVATGEGYAEKGSLYIKTDTGKLYINGGSKAEPLWKLVTSA